MKEQANFEGKLARVFLDNGKVLRGILHYDGDWLEIVDDLSAGRVARCNLSHVVAITLLKN